MDLSELALILFVGFIVFGLWYLIARNDIIWVRFIGGIVLMSLAVFTWNLICEAARYHAMQPYEEVLINISEGIEQGRAPEMASAITAYQNGDSTIHELEQHTFEITEKPLNQPEKSMQ